VSKSTAWDVKYRADGLSRGSLESAAAVGSVRATVPRLTPRARVLEAGTGTGRLAVYLARVAPVDVTALDLSPESLALGRRLAVSASPLAGSVSFVEGDLYELPFQEGRFDVVLSDSVIEHLRDPAAALKEFHRVLRPGGVVVLSVPNRWRPDGWDLYRRLAATPYRQTSFSPPGLRALLRDAGFEPVEMFGDELWLSRNLSLLRAAVPFRRAQQVPRESASATARSERPLPIRLLRQTLDQVLPSWLRINIGFVAERC
jgi:SAM-dependent methyltransferase